MNRLFELFGEIGVRGADAAEGAIDAVDRKAGGLSASLIRVGDRVQAFGDGVSRAGGVLTRTLTPAIGAATAATIAFANSKANAADQIAKASRVAGVEAQTLQELRFGLGELAGVTNRDVDLSLQRFNRRLGLAIQGGGAAKDTFSELGVAMVDAAGNARDSDAVLDDTLRALAGITSESERAATASEIFGEEAGPRLASALGDGIGALNAARDAAHETGAVMSQELLDASEEYNDMLGRQSARIGGVTNQLAEALLPALTKLVPVLVDRLIPMLERFVMWLTELVDAFTALPESMQTTIVAAVALTTALGPVLFILGKLISVAGVVIKTVGTLAGWVGRIAGLFTSLGSVLSPVVAVVTKLSGLLAAFWAGWEIGSRVLVPLLRMFPKVWHTIGRVVAAFVNWRDALASMWSSVKSILSSIVSGFESAFRAVYEATVGRVRDMVRSVIDMAQEMWDALTRNSIIPDMADQTIVEFERMASGAESAGGRMAEHMIGAGEQMSEGMDRFGQDIDEDAIARIDRAQAEARRRREDVSLDTGLAGNARRDQATFIDMSHSTFKDDRDMLDRMRRNGTDLTGAFAS